MTDDYPMAGLDEVEASIAEIYMDGSEMELVGEFDGKRFVYYQDSSDGSAVLSLSNDDALILLQEDDELFVDINKVYEDTYDGVPAETIPASGERDAGDVVVDRIEVRSQEDALTPWEAFSFNLSGLGFFPGYEPAVSVYERDPYAADLAAEDAFDRIHRESMIDLGDRVYKKAKLHIGEAFREERIKEFEDTEQYLRDFL